MEDDLKNYLKMEDDIKNNEKKGRRPQQKWKTTSKIKWKKTSSTILKNQP
jgi:hypothetical protein